MTISDESWSKYISDLRKVNDEAARLMLEFMDLHRDPDGMWNSREVRQAIIQYAYGLSLKYGEAAAELACEMYDAVGALSDVIIPAAVPAEVPTYADIAKAVNGTLKQSSNLEMVASAVARQVKMVSVDTVMKNALRDGAEWAWIPHGGETCAWCIALASRGWQRAGPEMRTQHAEHIHAHCQCEFAVRFGKRNGVSGYDPKDYLKIYNQYGGGGADRINALRRAMYEENKEAINAQKRAAYAARIKRQAEENQ